MKKTRKGKEKRRRHKWQFSLFLFTQLTILSSVHNIFSITCDAGWWGGWWWGWWWCVVGMNSKLRLGIGTLIRKPRVRIQDPSFDSLLSCFEPNLERSDKITRKFVLFIYEFAYIRVIYIYCIFVSGNSQNPPFRWSMCTICQISRFTERLWFSLFPPTRNIKWN